MPVLSFVSDLPSFSLYRLTFPQSIWQIILLLLSDSSWTYFFCYLKWTNNPIEGPWRWLSDQRARLLLRRSEFESRWHQQFFLYNLCLKKRKIKPFFKRGLKNNNQIRALTVWRRPKMETLDCSDDVYFLPQYQNTLSYSWSTDTKLHVQ